MSPFLLLLSKSLIGRRFKTFFLYEPTVNTLSLRDTSKAPCIHYTREEQGASKVCDKTPGTIAAFVICIGGKVGVATLNHHLRSALAAKLLLSLPFMKQPLL